MHYHYATPAYLWIFSPFLLTKQAGIFLFLQLTVLD